MGRPRDSSATRRGPSRSSRTTPMCWSWARSRHPRAFSPSISPRSQWPISLLVNGQGARSERPERLRAGRRPRRPGRAEPARWLQVLLRAGRQPASRLPPPRRHVGLPGHRPPERRSRMGRRRRHRGPACGSRTLIESLRADRSPALDGQGGPGGHAVHHAAVTPEGRPGPAHPGPPALVVRHADGRVTEFPSAGSAAWKDPDTGEVFAGSWHEVQQRLAAIGAAAPGLSSRHLDLAKTELANRDGCLGS